ncbi:hypothetical protein FACS189459_1630 [Bacilli bacterium]|nr:hypothetical protein FACS189459_1630 [Bacilli bacterium]
MYNINMINDAIILVNPSHRIGCIVKLSKKYNFTPICVLTMGNSFAFDYEQNFNNIKKLNNHVEVYRTYENGTTPNELSAILKSKYNVQAVVPYEEDLKYAEELASVLGVAGNDVSTVNIRKDKYNFNELLSKNSVRSVKQMMIEKNTTADDVVKYFNNTFPIVIKPIDGVLSVSVYICKNENEVHDAINGKNTFMSKFVAQEFIDGNEYIVNFITYKNKHHLTNICVYDRRVVNGHVINFGYQYITKQDDLFNSLMNYGINVLNASKVNCGTTHLEIKIDKKGPVLIECN